MKSKNSLFAKLYGLGYKLFARHWWVWWSNIRFKKSIRHNLPVNEDDLATNLAEIRRLVRALYRKFKWTKDGIDQLGDAITPPPQCYYDYLNGGLKDDCDGFHSLVYHCLANSGFKCYLLSVVAIGGGHCVLLMQSKNNKWYVIDYTSIYDGFDNAVDAVEDYNKNYAEIYNPKSEVVANDIISYDYDKEKLVLKNIKKL